MRELSTEVVVIGAGVVGLACAAELARDRHEVVILERRRRHGQETSSRNSGVVHAGLHYPPGSLKAQCCVEGSRMVWKRCADLDLPHRRTGKLIVATVEQERAQLDEIQSRALACGVSTLRRLDAREVARRDPGIRAVDALWSPETGIVDPAALVDSYRAEATAQGASLVLHTSVVALEPARRGWRVRTRNSRGEDEAVLAERVVNAAGLGADHVAELAGVDVDAAGWRQHLCKGSYFALDERSPRPRLGLVYPVPRGAGLGVHLTVDLSGRCLAGPDAEYVGRVDYTVDPSRAARFASSVAHYLPGVEAAHLMPDQAGMRPKLSPPGGGWRDFVVADGSTVGAVGTVHLIGIESPGLTSAGALARRVGRLISLG